MQIAHAIDRGSEGKTSGPPRGSEQLPIEASILNRLGDMVLSDRIGVVEVGEGAGYAEDFVVGAPLFPNGFGENCTARNLVFTESTSAFSS